jgi:hypothetical protein
MQTNFSQALQNQHLLKSVRYLGLLVGKPEGHRLLGKPTRMWFDNIKMDLKDIEWNDMDWTDLAQNKD